jgi:hypothetical protein
MPKDAQQRGHFDEESWVFRKGGVLPEQSCPPGPKSGPTRMLGHCLINTARMDNTPASQANKQVVTV